MESRIQRIQDDTALEESVKTRTLDLYKQAQTDLQTAADASAKAADWNRLREEAPQRQQELDAALAEAPERPPTADSLDGTPTDEISQMATAADQRLAEAQRSVEGLKAESDGRVERRRQLPELLANARQRLAELQAAAAPGPDVNPEEAEAQRAARRARIQALNAEIEALTAESASYEARGLLLPKRLDRANRELRAAQANKDALQGILAARRQAEAEEAAREARRLVLVAADAPEAVRERVEQLAQENEALVGRSTGPDGILSKTTQARAREAEIEDETKRLDTEFDVVVRRENAVGLNNAVGQLLRTYRASLPPRRAHMVAIQVRTETIGQAQLDQIDVDERRRDLQDISGQVEEILEAAQFDSEANAQSEELRRLLTQLLTTQQENLTKLYNNYELYISALLDLNAAERKLVEERDAFANYIDERVLWIRSGSIITASDFRAAVDALIWLVDPDTWDDAGRALLTDFQRNPIVNVLAVLVFSIAILLRPRVRARLTQLGERAEKRTCTTYLLTVEALVLTVLLSALVPAILGFVGWRLGVSLVGGEFVRVLATGTIIVAAFYFSLEFPRQLLRASGLGESHFEWPANASRFARNTVGRLMPVALPIILLIALFESQEQREWRESVGRLAFFIMMVVWAYLGHRYSNKNSPALPLIQSIAPPGAETSVRRFFYALSAGAPTALAAAAAAGYYYTALRIAWRIHASTMLVLLVVVGSSMAMRALLIARRRLAIEQARRKRAELKAAQKKAKDEGGEPLSVVEVHEPEYDLSQIDAQTSRLIRSLGVIALLIGMWFAWRDFVPALQVLDDVVLIKADIPIAGISNIGEVATTGESAPEAAPTEPTSTTIENKPRLTLSDLLFALFALAMTIVAFRNLPGLLEIALLQRLPLAPGERYAVKTVLGYVLAIVGLIITTATLGIEWGSIQWLVAALGFGIGFGLQEIIANFISGLIILFEQPIRVGDTVTIGEVSGTVSRIRIRATTITDWDLKELVVPNKEFVTGRLVNWSLSNPTLRVVIPVGVAYGTDTRMVRETLLAIADRSKRVLRQPAPQVWFTSFGDSALIFQTRVFIASIDDLLPVQDDMHHEIAAVFKEKGVEIAFPQRDLHIRSISAPITIQGEAVPEELQEQ